MGTVKDRNSKYPQNQKILEEVSRIHRRTIQKNDLNDLDNHDGVVTHLEPDILEYEVKCALGRSIIDNASGSDGISAELFKILNDDAVKVLHSICQQIWENDLMATGLEKVSFHSNPK